jgi:hypothetical protein
VKQGEDRNEARNDQPNQQAFGLPALFAKQESSPRNDPGRVCHVPDPDGGVEGKQGGRRDERCG